MYACVACAGSPHTLDRVAEGYVRVALQLAQHDPELVEDWRGPEDWRPGPREPVAPLLERVRSLQQELKPLTVGGTSLDGRRAAYLDGQLQALASAADRLLGASSPFDVEARDAVGVSSPPLADAARLGATREALDRALPGDGPLADRYVAYRTRLAVPVARVDAVLRAALAACRAVSARAIDLPGDEEVELAFGTGSRWDGFARYLGDHRTRIEVSRDATLDVTRALRLACHEGYPGHHVQHVLIDDNLVTERGWQEFGLTPGFGPHLLFVEGAAEAATDAAFPAAERAALYRDVLLPAAGISPEEAARLVQIEDLVAALEPAIIDVSRAYLDNTITYARAVERLRDEALTPEPEALLAFAERRRTRLLAYPEGRARAGAVIRRDGLAAIARWFDSQPFALQ